MKTYKFHIILWPVILAGFIVAILKFIEYTYDTREMVMWVWSGESIPIIEDPATMSAFFNFCKKPHNFNHKINRIYLSLGNDYENFLGKDTEKVKSLVNFLIEAHKRNIKVEYLAGAKEWAKPSKLINGINRAKLFVQFNSLVRSPYGRFDGLHYDVEPQQQLDDWDKKYTTYWETYITLLKKVQVIIDDFNQKSHIQPVTFAVDIPYWWDNDNFDNDGNRNPWGGTTSNKQVQEIVDYVTVMTYKTDAEKIIKETEDEISYADKIGKFLIIGVSFDKFKGVGFGRNVDYIHLENTLKDVSANFILSSSLKGFAIHKYGTYKK